MAFFTASLRPGFLLRGVTSHEVHLKLYLCEHNDHQSDPEDVRKAWSVRMMMVAGAMLGQFTSEKFRRRTQATMHVQTYLLLCTVNVV